MRGLTPGQIAKVCQGIYYGPEEVKEIEVTSITSDSRQVVRGCLFAALRGNRTDGHRYAASAYEQGAACALVEEPEGLEGPYIMVESCYQALKDIAEYYRQVMGIPVVAVAGSVGKTSTKEMIASVLGQKYRVLKTEGNFNNELGVPLTIFRIRPEDEVAVLELGISDFGEMHRLSKIAKPDICVMTNIGLCHLENLKSRDGILKAKSEIFDYAAKDCIACLNGDDDKLRTLKGKDGTRPCFYGTGQENDIRAEHIENKGLDGVDTDICAGDDRIRVHIPIPGMHMVYNALAGAAVALAMGMELPQIKAGIESLSPVGGRNNILNLPKLTVIDDCYNANPVSMAASLDVLSCALGRKVAILGDMGELGENEERLHRQVGVKAGQNGIQLILCAGKLAQHIAKGAQSTHSGSHIIYFPTREALLEELAGLLEEGDTVLVKASHFMGFEKVVDALKKY